MSFIQENIIEINLHLTKTYTLIQISDVHLVTYRLWDSDEAIQQAQNQESIWMKQRVDFATKFNENFDPSFLFPSNECLDQLIDFSNELHPDLVLLTGDIVDYFSEANYAYLSKALNNLQSPFLYSLGNHESPSYQFQELCQGKTDFNYIDLNDFFIVSIDNSLGKISQQQLESLKNLIETNKPILLAMHIPIMTELNETDLSKLDSYYSIKYSHCDETTSQFINLITNASEIKAILCGHTHGSILSYIAPNKPEYCCSSGLIGKVNKIIIK
ncbi:MAG: metallophosphoesterase [Candidatus Izemoplasmatales bacterium]